MINVVKSLATVILLTFSIPALAQVDELPALGIRAVYDSATGIVEITQSGVAAAVTVHVGVGQVNSTLLSDLDQTGMILYERNGTALILKSDPGALTLVSRTPLPSPSWAGANIIKEGFRFVTSPNGKISAAIFRYTYHQQIGGRGITNYYRTILSNLTDNCAADLNLSLSAPQTVDQNWTHTTPIVQNLIQTREDECAAADFGFSLPIL